MQTLGSCLIAAVLLTSSLVVPGGAPAGVPAGMPGVGPDAAAGGGDDARAPLEGGLERSRALVIMLHGGSSVGAPADEVARRALGSISSEARRVRMRVLVPVAPEAAWRAARGGTPPWLAPEGETAVLELVHEQVALGRADVRRVYLAGHGMGATAALTLGARYPSHFAAVAVWSGTPAPLWDAERNVVGLAEPVVEGLAGVPTYLWTGTDDERLDWDTLRVFVHAMQRAEEDDESYDFVWDRGEGGHGVGKHPDRGLRFLKRHSKPASTGRVWGRARGGGSGEARGPPG